LDTAFHHTEVGLMMIIISDIKNGHLVSPHAQSQSSHIHPLNQSISSFNDLYIRHERGMDGWWYSQKLISIQKVV